MLINNDEMLIEYFERLIGGVWKILPLYEEENIGIKSYVDSLTRGIANLENVIRISCSYEYLSLLTTLKVVEEELAKKDSNKAIIKRELFKSIDIIKIMVCKIEDGD